MPDAVEPAGNDVDQETAGERISGLPRDLLAIAILVAIVLPVEDDGVRVGTDQAVVRYSDPPYSGTGHSICAVRFLHSSAANMSRDNSFA